MRYYSKFDSRRKYVCIETLARNVYFSSQAHTNLRFKAPDFTSNVKKSAVPAKNLTQPQREHARLASNDKLRSRVPIIRISPYRGLFCLLSTNERPDAGRLCRARVNLNRRTTDKGVYCRSGREATEAPEAFAVLGVKVIRRSSVSSRAI